ncbi:MAG: DUF4340 domain-containing protein [Spirochaetota bacterium]
MNQKVNNASAAMRKKNVPLKRNQITELLILAGLAILLSLYLFLRSAGSFSYTLPQFEEISDIQAIRWSRSDGTERNLRKDGVRWHIDKYPAKQNYIDTLLEQLRNPVLQDLVSKSGNLLTFGLNDERAYHLEALDSDGNLLREFYVGKSSSSGRYSFIRLGKDDSRVFTLSENLTSILEKSIADLRDRLVLNFSSNDIEKVEINGAEQAVTAEKKDDKWQVPEGVTWGEDEINRLVNRFSNMNAQAFLTEYPQDENQYEVKFIAKGGVSYTVTIGAVALEEDRGYAAKSSSYGFPFTLNNYTVESMLKDFGFIEEEESE